MFIPRSGMVYNMITVTYPNNSRQRDYIQRIMNRAGASGGIVRNSIDTGEQAWCMSDHAATSLAEDLIRAGAEFTHRELVFE